MKAWQSLGWKGVELGEVREVGKAEEVAVEFQEKGQGEQMCGVEKILGHGPVLDCLTAGTAQGAWRNV